MKTGTRLLLPLLAVVTAVMLLFATWAVVDRERSLRTEAQRETVAYAIALGLALEGAYRDRLRTDVQEIIDRLSREETVYGVLLYDEDGRVAYLSSPLEGVEPAPRAEVARVLEAGETATLERAIDAQPVFSVLHPIRDPLGRIVGAYEVAQPLDRLADEIANTRLRFLLNTLTLLAALTIGMLVLVRHLIARPLQRIAGAAQALGRGELGHRIGTPPGGVELRVLAAELDRTAGQLESARSGLVAQTEERLSLERRLRESEKLAVTGNLAAGLAHEIAAPLHVIRGRAELLARHEGLSDKERRNLAIISEQIDRITFIVRNLLDFARRREPRLEAIDLASVIGAVAEFLEAEFSRRNIAFAYDVAGPLRTIGDARLLHQVLLNVLMNALQAMEAANGGGRLAVRAREAAEDGAPRVVVEIHDSGTGIPGAVLPSIFDPFFTTKAGGSGTGLGLAIARSIVEEHGGRIEAWNHTEDDAAYHGRGAAFRIVLPGAPGAQPAHA
jgi:two-component system, NtrC family, sensor kinase